MFDVLLTGGPPPPPLPAVALSDHCPPCDYCPVRVKLSPPIRHTSSVSVFLMIESLLWTEMQRVQLFQARSRLEWCGNQIPSGCCCCYTTASPQIDKWYKQIQIWFNHNLISPGITTLCSSYSKYMFISEVGSLHWCWSGLHYTERCCCLLHKHKEVWILATHFNNLCTMQSGTIPLNMQYGKHFKQKQAIMSFFKVECHLERPNN